MQISESHLSHFKSTTPNSGGWLGSAPKSWFAWVQKNTRPQAAICNFKDTHLPHEQVSRAQLKALVKNSAIDTLSCCIAILAWGGMNRQHGSRLFSSSQEWVCIADEIRNGKLDRSEAYEKFAHLREAKKLPGIGPAYFTKLIFFLMPDDQSKGYIMDQWTSVSVNLLFEKPLIDTSVLKVKRQDGSIRVAEIVKDSNSHLQYEMFCQSVEWLAKKINVSPELAEEMMFSEGRGKGTWRNYVIEQRSKNSKNPIQAT
jgi:hypothetical protein